MPARITATEQLGRALTLTSWSTYTAISRKVVRKSARKNPGRYCGWFWVRCSSKKFEIMAQEAVDVCLCVLKENNKRRFDNYSVRDRVLIISHITFRDCRVHIFAYNLSRNSCICNSRRVLLLSTQVAQVGNMIIGRHRQCCITFEI